MTQYTKYAPRPLGHRLDDDGRCCGRKPLTYKRPTVHYFCSRCDAEYSAEGVQNENWQWKLMRDRLHHTRTVREAAMQMLEALHEAKLSLLYASEEARNTLYESDYDDVFDKVRTAISKAEGRTDA